MKWYFLVVFLFVVSICLVSGADKPKDDHHKDDHEHHKDEHEHHKDDHEHHTDDHEHHKDDHEHHDDHHDEHHDDKHNAEQKDGHGKNDDKESKSLTEEELDEHEKNKGKEKDMSEENQTENVTYKATSAVYMDILKPVEHEEGHKNETVRLIIGLFDQDVPKTVQNFRDLCTGAKGFGYKDTPIHCIYASFFIQGGDWEFKNGTGGRSTFKNETTGQYSYFEAENYKIEHSDAGFVTTAPRKENEHGSQFIITCEESNWMNEHHVVFGKVLEGQKHINEISFIHTEDNKHAPKYPVIITECGIHNLKEPVLVTSTRTTHSHSEL
uniref:peptidyl-prolyl cis-trans isomerase-like n=1 Tax=Styela clava TaxID=7725 RepID=UPI00193AC4E3|nr:peptidyl-prolyl cis-trans isomerase-like [Styela clava]